MKTNSLREWFTAQEIAGLPLMPESDRSVRRLKLKPSRKKESGKGYEYHISSLPKETQRALKISQTKKQQAAEKAGTLNDARLQGRIEGTEAQAIEKQLKIRQARALSELSPKEQARVRARTEALACWEVYVKDFEHINEATEEFVDAWNENRLDIAEAIRRYAPKLSRTSLFRWKAAYTREGAAGLAASYQYNGRRSVIEQQPEVLEFVEGMLAKMPHTTPANMLRALEGQFDQRGDVQLIGQRALGAWMANWKVKNKRLFTAVANPDAFKNQYMVAGGDAAEGIHRLNQLWEMDSSPADIMCTDGRFTLIACLDVFSRRTVLTVRKSSDSYGVVLTARKAMLEWGLDGQGEQKIRVDNGKDYASHYFQIVADTLGIELVSTDPYAGEQKPFVERFFRSFSHGLVELLEGFIGHNVAEKKAIEAQFSFADRLQKKKQGVIKVSMSSTELQAFCDRWLNAFYMHEPHSGLNGRTPDEMVQNWVEPVSRIEDERALDLLLEPIPGGKGERSVQKKGVKLDGGWYIAAELGARIGDRLMVRYDTADIGRVYLFELSGEFVCMAENPQITGISREELAREMKKEQKKVAEQKAELKKKGRKIKQGELVDKILARKEREIEERRTNVVNLPKRTASHDTEYLSGARAALDEADSLNQPAPGFDAQGEPTAEMQTAMSRVVTDAVERNKQREDGNLMTTAQDRFDRWKKLNALVEAGETLCETDQRWKTGYETTDEWEGYKMVLDAFGE